ncbi:MAG: acetyl-CoA carboxylase biotin carboxyl carrier protein [Victivallaceae bacterium]|nr:acetyl-CoA carboxylase biotin carboxyl carrier protein [Victivallaceae bacterium]
MNIDEIKEVAELMREYDLCEFSIEAENCNLCLRRNAVMPGAVPASMPAVAAAPVAAAPVAPATSAAPSETIDSPLVGTFYRASSPEAQPFIAVGDKVSADTTIGVIEAMKVMNEVKAEKSGIVKEILIDNGQPVEYGQPLVVLG